MLIKNILFRKNIKKLDEMHIKQYLERQGFELVYKNTAYGADLIRKLKIENADKPSFIYTSKNLKYVFLDGTQGEDDRLMTLLHECGHIELEHKSNTKYNEAEAWTFAFNIVNLRSKIIRQIAVIAIAVLMTLIVTASLMTGFTNTDTIQPDARTPVSDIPSQIQKNDAPDIPVYSEPVISSDATQFYYVTKYGKKYHNADCYHIKNSNSHAITSTEASEAYEPCKDCIIK